EIFLGRPQSEIVPKGLLKQARRFNAGNGASTHQVPKGRLTLCVFSLPFGTQPFTALPGVRMPGYSRTVPPGLHVVTRFKPQHYFAKKSLITSVTRLICASVNSANIGRLRHSRAAFSATGKSPCL